MRVLLDTHVLLWSGNSPERLTGRVRTLLTDPQIPVFFSVISLWEVGVKRNLNRPDFQFDPQVLRREAVLNGYYELPLFAEHALAVAQLPSLHRDPFDRLLLCQAIAEDMTLITNDDKLFGYPARTERA